MTDKSKSWLERIGNLLTGEPRDRDHLIEVLHDATKSQLLNQESLSMIEGVLAVSEKQVRDIMIPRSQMTILKEDWPIEKIIPIIIESGHSRFPVTGDNLDQVRGILLAKDLLRFFQLTPNDNKKFHLEEILRPVTFIPESKRLDSLLKEFRDKHSHLAIVVDEYGGISGLITIEDVIEQIVGDIEDEYDEDDENDFIKSCGKNEYMINAILEISAFNEYFNTHLSDEQFDTIGGLVLHQFSHLPKHGEETVIQSFHFTVMHSDNRRIQSLKMKLLNAP